MDGAAFYASEAFGSEEGMVVEFWLCVGAGVFVGNAMSTVSMNVCAVRRAMDKPCANMDYMMAKYPCFPHPDFDKKLEPLV